MATDFPDEALHYLEQELGAETFKDVCIEEAKSAQQKVWILSLPTTQSSQHNNLLGADWSQALETGRNRLVVRQWRGSSRWWNLNSNESSPKALAKAEVAAYRIAFKALPRLHMPRLLHFDDGASNSYPWAVFSYVGEHSSGFDTTAFTMQWIHGMVKTRPEFGFDEPHPRWGRVPVEQAVEYTLKVLKTVTIPLHKYIAANPSQSWGDLSTNLDGRAVVYQDMVLLYEDAQTRMFETLQKADTRDAKLRQLSYTLGKCVRKLLEGSVDELPPVLVHMDCQPQNLLFFQGNKDTGISSVLDWEEAAYADPRFELLLLCRKVCANREQADIIWNAYEKESELSVGPIEPWLQLETVHSITTLVLQSMNLLGGGRSPWENKPDLKGKIERELNRLVEFGWEFCREAIE